MFRSTRRLFSSYDVIVVGGGPGGYVAAIRAAQAGLKSACVESRGALGGTCLNVGCIPSKALLHATHLAHDGQKKFATYGIEGGDGLSVNLAKLMKYKDGTVTSLTKGIEGLFKKNGVDYLRGHGTFVSANEIEVDGEKHTASKGIIIATGSVPVDLPFLPVDETRIVTSTGALSLKKVPERMVVVGGGVIGLEMASVWSRLGSKVTVVEFIDQVAGASCDAEVAKETQKVLKKQGIEFHLKRKCTSADIPDDVNAPITLHTEAAAGGSPKSFEADVVLVSVGRRPFTDNLGLDKAGVELNDRKQVTINESYETTAKGVYAIGDVVRGPMLAHKAEEEGVAAVEIIATGSGHVNLDAIPSVIYTEPEVAWVGKTEQELKADGVKYKVGKFPMLANSRARANGTTDGFVKLLADAETDRVLGAHIVATNAGELIQELVLAIEHEACSEDIARTSHAHPTLSEGILEAAHMTYTGKAIHF